MTHVWDSRRVESERAGPTVSVHVVHLPPDQGADVESDFLSSHLPFALGGVAGVHPDGSAWILVLQQTARAQDPEMSFGEELGILDRAVWRAIAFNPGARVAHVTGWRRPDLERVYERAGVMASSLELWTLADLVAGLLAECCGADLASLTVEFVPGCAFPGLAHACQHDVFLDVFSQWQQRHPEQ